MKYTCRQVLSRKLMMKEFSKSTWWQIVCIITLFHGPKTLEKMTSKQAGGQVVGGTLS